jgi:hypothetical protein
MNYFISFATHKEQKIIFLSEAYNNKPWSILAYN